MTNAEEVVKCAWYIVIHPGEDLASTVASV